MAPLCFVHAENFFLILLRFKSRSAASRGNSCEFIVAHALRLHMRHHDLNVPRHQAGYHVAELYRLRKRSARLAQEEENCTFKCVVVFRWRRLNPGQPPGFLFAADANARGVKSSARVIVDFMEKIYLARFLRKIRKYALMRRLALNNRESLDGLTDQKRQFDSELALFHFDYA